MAKKTKEKCPYCEKEFAQLNRHKCKKEPKDSDKDRETNVADEQFVFVGNRPLMNYVTAAMMALGNCGKCTVCARGRMISKAVDACEVLRNRFMTGVDYGDIRITTEELSSEGRKSNVSSMEIDLISG